MCECCYLAPHRGRARYCNAHVCLCVCVFVCLLLCEISDFRKVYWSPRFVCLYVCLFVRPFAMYRPHRWSDCPDCVTVDVSRSWDVLAFLFWKSDKAQGQGHHFCENQIMGHNFWTGSGRYFWLVAERSLSNSAYVRDAPFWRTTSRFYVTWL